MIVTNIIISLICFFFVTGGELITQRYAGHTFLVTIYPDYLSASLVTPNSRIEARVTANLLDNKWHTVEFLQQIRSLKVLINRKETVIANSSYNTELLTDSPSNDAAILIIGHTYSGCMLDGPGFNFSTTISNSNSVIFGPCPLMQGRCSHEDILIHKAFDYCLHDPCMQKGICVSRTETYEVSFHSIKFTQ